MGDSFGRRHQILETVEVGFPLGRGLVQAHGLEPSGGTGGQIQPARLSTDLDHPLLAGGVARDRIERQAKQREFSRFGGKSVRQGPHEDPPQGGAARYATARP